MAYNNYYEIISERVKIIEQKAKALQEEILALHGKTLPDLVSHLNRGLNAERIARNIREEKHATDEYRHALNDEMALAKFLKLMQDGAKEILKQAERGLADQKQLSESRTFGAVGIYDWRYSQFIGMFSEEVKNFSYELLEILRGEVALVMKVKGETISVINQKSPLERRNFDFLRIGSGAVPLGGFSINLRHLYQEDARKIMLTEAEAEKFRQLLLRIYQITKDVLSHVNTLRLQFLARFEQNLKRIPVKE